MPRLGQLLALPSKSVVTVGGSSFLAKALRNAMRLAEAVVAQLGQHGDLALLRLPVDLRGALVRADVRHVAQLHQLARGRAHGEGARA